MVIELQTWTRNLGNLHDSVFKADKVDLRDGKSSINFLRTLLKPYMILCFVPFCLREWCLGSDNFSLSLKDFKKWTNSFS